ncbi:SURNod19 domain-containing protein [Cephalotus follicularis]|uniref:SURNod19 domain-containing protein n=1 Tax=Cephalotus follicularis TaxID=3775 RepID=A0A1Q3CNW4_CEPFO|nr:SURNod19 domain-containing protein [Cephalotus follicularis]
MMHCSHGWLLSLAILLALSIPHSQAILGNENKIKTAVFLSPKFVLGPGSVEDKYYYDVDFPRGHIFLKSFNGEVIDEAGNPIPLHETYLHHWVVARYYQRKGTEISNREGYRKLARPDYISVRNSGICQKNSLGQYFGLGSETRKTSTHIPDPYGIEIGDSKEIPEGFEEKWMLNVHAIDTRGVEDRLGCTECRCNLYNVTEDAYGRPLRPGYVGGLRCCYDHTQCKLRQGFEGARRSLYLRYTVKWVEWDSYILPVKIYIMDITDTWKRLNNSTGLSDEHDCRVEYDVESCSINGAVDGKCIDSKKLSLTMPIGGYVVYGVAHQHSGGISSTLYREDGQVICSSKALYGDGEEAGNEAGYIVGMSTCYPRPGSVKIANGETLILESNYSSSEHHTGVMALFYILVADETPKPLISLQNLVQTHEILTLSTFIWVAALLGLVIAVIAVRYRLSSGREDGYQIVM